MHIRLNSWQKNASYHKNKAPEAMAIVLGAFAVYYKFYALNVGAKLVGFLQLAVAVNVTSSIDTATEKAASQLSFFKAINPAC